MPIRSTRPDSHSKHGRLCARRLAFAFAIALAASLPARAFADASRVVLLRPPNPSRTVEETLTRARAELELAGFEVRVVEQHTSGAAVRDELEQAAGAEGAIAAIAVESERLSADVWVADRLTGKTLVRRLGIDTGSGPRAPSTLAIRAVELLRASLDEGPDSPSDDAPSLPSDVDSWMTERAFAARSALAGFGASLGLGVLTSFDHIGPAFAPALRLSYAIPEGLGARIDVVGPAGGPRLSGPLGKANVLHGLFLAEAFYAPLLEGSRFVPVASAGIGASFTHASGDLEDVSRAASGAQWAAAFAFGGGVVTRPDANIALVLDANLVFTAPRVVVAMAGEPIGSMGRPTLLAALSVVATND